MAAERIHADLAIVGAGSAGLSVAAGAAQLGLSCVLFEKAEMGGDCLNTGCVPSKALIAAAARAHSLRSGQRLGVGSSGPDVNFAAVMTHVRATISAIEPMDSEARFTGLGVRVVREAARFVGPREITSDSVSVRARKIVIATGSRPSLPSIPGLSETPFLTNETVFTLQALPRRLVILGAGPIGVELGQAFARLGSTVTIVDGGRALGREDPDVAAVVTDQLRSEGIEIIENARITKVALGPVVCLETDSLESQITGDQLLVALGREAACADLNLEAAGIRYGKEGVWVDRRLRTTNPRVYAIGDVAGKGQFTHLAGAHASLFIRRALFGLQVDLSRLILPRVTYTDPEVAVIGMTAEHARTVHGDKLRLIEAPFSSNDRAETEGDVRGFARLVSTRSGKILGVQIVGKGAGEQALLWSLMMSAGVPLSSLASSIAPYPTRSEISKRLAGQFFAGSLFSARTRRLVSLLKRIP